MQTPQRLVPSSNRVWTFLVYAVMIGMAAVAFLFIRAEGETLVAPAVPAGVQDAVGGAQINPLLHVLLVLAVVIATARVMGILFKFLHQPPVIGEIIGGMLLGPSVLGRLAPEASAYILPGSVAPMLGIIAQLGVILYMFLVGLDLDLRALRKSGYVTLAISHASIVLPFLLGAMFALALYERFSDNSVAFTTFALFLGVSMSVTAFPVLARILTDRRMHKSRMGMLALTCAAVDDVTAWCLLAFVVSVAQSRISNAVVTLVLTGVFIAFILLVARPLIARLAPRLEASGRVTEGGMALIFVAILLSALATEYIGIHAIFGAFLLGAVIPHNSRVAGDVTAKLQDVVRVMFLPAFFAFTGMRTQFGLLQTGEDWLLCGGIIAVATVGKFGGTLVAAKLMGMSLRDSSALGILMNTRGLVELIVLNIGLDLGVISPTLFAMLVLMALVTTFATTPILDAILGKKPWVEEAAAPEAARARG